VNREHGRRAFEIFLTAGIVISVFNITEIIVL
jgi:hypothetical protein